MRKLIIGFLIIFVSFSFDVSAQIISKDGLFIGRAWKELAGEQKKAYIIGFYDLISYVYNWKFNINENTKDEIDEEEVQNVLRSLSDMQVTTKYDDIITYIDYVYRDTTNLNIPVMYVYNLFVQKYKGRITDQDVEKALLELRKEYN